MNMTHPDILKTEKTGGIPPKGEPEYYNCIICENDFPENEMIKKCGEYLCLNCDAMDKEELWDVVLFGLVEKIKRKDHRIWELEKQIREITND